MNNVVIPPSQVVVQAFGGVRAAARLLNCQASAVSRWSKTGLVPAVYQRRVLQTAWSRGIDITAHDIIFGRNSL